jgi:hypothetical protein
MSVAMLKNYIKSLKAEHKHKSWHELPAQDRLQIGKLYLEERGAVNTIAYREVLQAIKGEQWADNLLLPIEVQLKELWDSEDEL